VYWFSTKKKKISGEDAEFYFIFSLDSFSDIACAFA
jgi:hypothetical protein